MVVNMALFISSLSGCIVANCHISVCQLCLLNFREIVALYSLVHYNYSLSPSLSLSLLHIHCSCREAFSDNRWDYFIQHNHWNVWRLRNTRQREQVPSAKSTSSWWALSLPHPHSSLSLSFSCSFFPFHFVCTLYEVVASEWEDSLPCLQLDNQHVGP